MNVVVGKLKEYQRITMWTFSWIELKPKALETGLNKP